MRRTKESQKAHLLNELDSKSTPKKAIATRGTKVFMEDYKQAPLKKSSTSIIPLMLVWIIISLLVWRIFFRSIPSLIIIEVIGCSLIYLLTNKVFKTENYELIKQIEEKKTLIEQIDEHRHLFTKEITELIDEILNNISYLKSFSEKKLLDIEQEHYLERCQNKHLIDLLNYLKSSHKDHLETNQKNILEQLIGINDKLKRIVLIVQKSIETDIRVQAVFNKDY